jgi:ketosteroid isomerase-like protein
MKNIFFFLICLSAIFPSCTTKPNVAKHHTEESKQEIMQADKDMSALAAKEGFNKALCEYADDSIVKLNNGSNPIIGKRALGESLVLKADPKTLTWYPVNAQVAYSCELGYTWGKWKFVKPDTTYYGNYFTVWKKDESGKWKIVLDGGNNSPQPK